MYTNTSDSKTISAMELENYLWITYINNHSHSVTLAQQQIIIILGLPVLGFKPTNILCKVFQDFVESFFKFEGCWACLNYKSTHL